MSFNPLPRRSGRIAYRHRAGGAAWGEESWTITRGRDGGRIMTAHCEMAFGADDVVRDSILSVDAQHQPRDCYVSILNHGLPTGSGWFRFGDHEAECESFTLAQGRVAQRRAIERPLRGFGIHALQGDGWMAATFPFERGIGHEQFYGRSLLHSLHHFGASGPLLETSTSGFRYEARETVEVPAGRFDCHRIGFIGMTNAHPDYSMWISADGDFLFVRGVVEGYMDSVFELEQLNGEVLA